MEHFTGVSDPYEPPVSPELVIDTSKIDIQNAIKHIVSGMEQSGYIETSAQEKLRHSR